MKDRNNEVAAASTVTEGDKAAGEAVTSNTPAVASGEATSPSGADSTESNAGETGNGENVSAEKSDASERSSDDSTAGTSKPATTSAEGQPSDEAPVVDGAGAGVDATSPGKVIPGVGQPNHDGYFAELKIIAEGIEVEICEDVAELEKTLKDYSVELLEAVERLRAKHNIK